MVILFSLNFIYLTENERSLQIPANSEARSDKSQKLESHFRTPMWMIGTQPLDPSLLPSRVCTRRELE